MKEPRRRQFLRPCVVLVPTLLACADARAVDRPGTPIGVVVAPDTAPGKLPAIVVHFRNTANEAVTFWCEWTVNGALMGDPLKALKYPKLQCLQTASCTGLFSGSTTEPDDPGRAFGKISAPDENAKNKAFKIVDVDWSTEYCFHLKARKVDGGIVSGEWSPWSCGRTPAAPPLPAAFPRPVATFFPGETGGVAGRSVDGLVPDRVLVEWENTGGTAHYEIQGPGRPYKNRWSSVDNVSVDSQKSKQTALFDVSGVASPYSYTVCAVNVRGRTCSARVSTERFGGKEATVAKISTPTPLPAKVAAGVLPRVSTPTPGPDVRKALKVPAH
jgi:hypothetical protein